MTLYWANVTQQCLEECQCLPFGPHQGHTQVFSMPWPQQQLKRRKTKHERIVEIRIAGKEKQKGLQQIIYISSLSSYLLKRRKQRTEKKKSQPVNNFRCCIFSCLLLGLLSKTIKSSASLLWQKLPIEQLKDVQLK